MRPMHQHSGAPHALVLCVAILATLVAAQTWLVTFNLGPANGVSLPVQADLSAGITGSTLGADGASQLSAEDEAAFYQQLSDASNIPVAQFRNLQFVVQGGVLVASFEVVGGEEDPANNFNDLKNVTLNIGSGNTTHPIDHVTTHVSTCKDCLAVLIIIVVFSVLAGIVVILAINLCVKKHLDKLIAREHKKLSGLQLGGISRPSSTSTAGQDAGGSSTPAKAGGKSNSVAPVPTHTAAHITSMHHVLEERGMTDLVPKNMLTDDFGERKPSVHMTGF